MLSTVVYLKNNFSFARRKVFHVKVRHSQVNNSRFILKGFAPGLVAFTEAESNPEMAHCIMAKIENKLLYTVHDVQNRFAIFSFILIMFNKFVKVC